MKLFRFLSIAIAISSAIACEKQTIPDTNGTKEPEPTEQGSVSYSISFDATDVKTKVIYNDNIDDKEQKTFTMNWKEGDEVVAIRWPEKSNTAPVDWFTLEAHKVTEDGMTKILFKCDRAGFRTPLAQGERFVLVHGDFVLGDKNDKTSLSFPISRFNFPYHEIHHGGTVEGGEIIFPGQDGTLDGLSNHEFMVKDAYINITKNVNPEHPEEEGIVQLTYQREEEGYNQTDHIKLKSINTIIRLQAFLPDSYFTGENAGEKIQALSFSTVEHNNTFYRYFRMHPNNDWSIDENDHSEKNSYLRVDLKEGQSPLEDNSEQDKLIVRQHNSNGTPGRIVTAYFAVPSIPINGERLIVHIFTNSHVYTRKAIFQLKDTELVQGSVIPMNISFKEDAVFDNRANTDAKLGVSFAPGLVYADKTSGNWEYGIYQNQGQYAGMSRQSLDFGEYFIFGSADPTDCYHAVLNGENTSYKKGPSYYKSSNKIDVARLVYVNDIMGNPYSMLTKPEAERLIYTVMHEGNYCIGYYYYPVHSKTDRTYHILSENGKKTREKAAVPPDSEDTYYTGSYGIWIGTKSQPTYDKQDLYIFIPNSKQLNNGTVNESVGFEKKDSNGNLYPEGYTLTDKKYLYYPGSGWETEEETLKFSTNVFEEGKASDTCIRLQFWYKNSGFDTDMTNVKEMNVFFGRPVRPVIF